MAAILQLRRGAITDFNGYGTNLSEPYFDTDRDTIHIGTSDGTGSNADWITLVKLSQANRDFTKSEPNTGSLWIVGDITASDNPDINLGPYDAINNPNGYDIKSGVLPSSIHSTSSMYLNGNLTASHAWFRRDVRIDGHLILGDSDNPSTYDVVNVQSDFSGSLIPDNDAYGTLTASADTAYHDFGTNAKRWRNIYLQNNGSDEEGFISASHLDLTGRAKIDGTLEVDGQSTLASANVEDLTNNRIVIAGIDGELEDDINFTFDGVEFNIGQDNFTVQRDSGNTHTSGTLDVDGQATLASANVEDLTETRLVIVGSNGELQDSPNLTFDEPNFRLIGDYYQSGSGATFQFVGAGGEITGSWTISELAVDNGIVFTNEFGTLDNQNEFTWDGGTLYVDGNISASGTLEVDGQSSLASLKVEDLTNDRIVIAGTDGEVEDDQYFRYTGNDFIIGSAEHFKVTTATGNTFISGAVQMFSTLNVDDQSTLASLNVEDLTDNRVVIVGAGGEIEDDGNLTFNGTELNIGTGNFTVQQGSGNVHTVGNVDIDLDLNIDGGDLTTNQSTFNLLNSNATTVNAFGASTTINVGTGGQGGGLTTIGHDLTVVGDLTIQGETTQLNTTTLNVEDKNILIASGALNASAANGAGITIDGADATLTYESTNNWFTFDRDTQVQGDLYVTNEISSSTVSGIGNVELYSASVDSRLDYLEGPFSTSVDSRLDEIEGPMSTSLDLRLVEIFATGSDHETRLDTIEGPFSTSLDSRLDTIEGPFSTSLDSRLDLLESFSESIESHLPSGTVSGSTQITELGFLVTSSALYNDANNLAVGTSTPTNLGATQFTINDSDTAGTSGLISFTDSDVVKSYDYVLDNYRYIDTNTGVGIVLKPNADGDKSWIIDTEGDLVSNGGAWSSGSVYTNNLIASSSITASNMVVDNDIVTNNLFVSSSVNITQTLNLAPQDPLPSGTIGDLAVSGSNLFFYNGAWTQVV
jgi:hypothetical protein